MFKREFDLGKNIESEGLQLIDFDAINEDSNSKKALAAGNWTERPSNGDKWKSAIKITDAGVVAMTDRDAAILKVAVPEFDSYKVTVTLSAVGGAVKDASIFTGRRNLVRKNICLSEGEEIQLTFYSYVSPYIPAISYTPCLDKFLYVSAVGKNLCISRINIVQERVKTVFIAGDSTLTDQGAETPYYPICSCAGWAQDLLMHCKDMAVCNYAHSGLTTNCFKDDGHWALMKPQIKAGDIFMIQFGHNDQKRRNLAAAGGYYENLKWYVNEVRDLGATPIICSPISRVPITDETGTYSLLDSYARACQKVAQEEGVAYIDLHSYTFDYWNSLEPGEVKNYFIPGDITHTNDYGAVVIAKYVAECMSQMPEAADNIVPLTVERFTPQDDTLDFPKEKIEGSVFDVEPPFMDIADIPNPADFAAAFKKGLLDPCVMNAHPFSPMPRAQLLMIYLRAIKMNGTRPYLGKYVDMVKDEWDSSYLQTCINENLIDEATVDGNHFRPDEDLTYQEFASFCVRGMQSNGAQRNIDLKDCFNRAKELGIVATDKNPEDKMNRLDVYVGLSKLMDLVDSSDKELPSDTEMHPVH